MIDFAPSVYEHCARLIGRRPWEVSRNENLLFQAQAASYELYRHRPVVVGVDIYNLEAEAYGSAVGEPAGAGIPAVVNPCCSTVADVLCLAPFDPRTAGRIPMVIRVARRLRRTFPDADVRVPAAGPFSVATNLLPPETLLAEAVLNPAAVRDALLHLAAGQLKFCRHIIESGLDIAFFESAAAPPLLSPDLFREVELPPLRRMLEGAAAETGRPVPCIIGGDTLPILEDILSTGTGYVICPSPTETDQVAFMKVMAAHPDVTVRVNMRPDVIAFGSWPEIQAEVDRVVKLIAARERACLGAGALPYETPPENVLRIREYLAAADH